MVSPQVEYDYGKCPYCGVYPGSTHTLAIIPGTEYYTSCPVEHWQLENLQVMCALRGRNYRNQFRPHWDPNECEGIVEMLKEGEGK